MTNATETQFEQALEQYRAGAEPESLIPVFKDICDRAPKNPTGWACLAWLYLLVDKPKPALKAAQKSVKLDAKAPQARINLALAMLETDAKGVRDHIESAQQMMMVSEEIRQEVIDNIEDGLSRKPNWKSLQRVKSWLL